MNDRLPHRSSRPRQRARDTGVYTWDLNSDTVYADSAVAAIFGLDPEQAAQGMPIQTYLDRIHQGDKASVAKSIHDAVVTGEPYQKDYRVVAGEALVTVVTAFGRCFRNSAGEPTHYAGIIVPISGLTDDTDPVAGLCQVAYRLAIEAGQFSVAKKVLSVLTELGSNKDPVPPNRH